MLPFPIDIPQLEKWVSFVKGFPQDFKILFRVANTHANVDLNGAAPLSLVSEWVIRARAVSRLQCRRSATGHAPATPVKRSAAPRLGERGSYSAVDIHALVSPPRGRFTAGLPPGDDGRLERIHGVPLGDGELSSDQGG
jgi:hypothetical protein